MTRLGSVAPAPALPELAPAAAELSLVEELLQPRSTSEALSVSNE